MGGVVAVIPSAASEESLTPLAVSIREWRDEDFPAVQALSAAEGWTMPIERPDAAIRAWRSSGPALVAVADREIIGFVRAISDGAVTTCVAELLVAPQGRGRGLARSLLDAVRARAPGSRLDILATSDSRGFYEHLGFRPFSGFRISSQERLM